MAGIPLAKSPCDGRRRPNRMPTIIGVRDKRRSQFGLMVVVLPALCRPIKNSVGENCMRVIANAVLLGAVAGTLPATSFADSLADAYRALHGAFRAHD